MRVLSFLLCIVPLASAIFIADPAAGSTLVKGSAYDLTWTFVNTDPTTFSILLVNFVNFPPFYTELAHNVDTTLGSYTVTIPCNVDPSYGFQFNAIMGDNVYVIYAQSPRYFTITGDATTCGAGSSTTSTSTSTGGSVATSSVTTCPAATPTTITIIDSGSSTFTCPTTTVTVTASSSLTTTSSTASTTTSDTSSSGSSSSSAPTTDSPSSTTILSSTLSTTTSTSIPPGSPSSFTTASTTTTDQSAASPALSSTTTSPPLITTTTTSTTSFGLVPRTIGWSSDYSSPVTLDSVPHGGQAAATAPPADLGHVYARTVYHTETVCDWATLR